MKHVSGRVFSLILLCATIATTGVSLSVLPVVDLGYAKYEGVSVRDQVTNAAHTQFLGIRFAAPPTGSARFRKPSQPAVIPGIHRANAEPSRCFEASQGNAPTTPFRIGSSKGISARFSENHNQRRTDAEIVPGFSEDCLFLNVYIPGGLGQKSHLPVVIWIHGGGYVSGSASGFNGTDIFDGNDIVRESGEGVVVVIIQYRLGVFGFLPGQKVKDGGDLNVGLLDQQFAFKWVQDHITKFGGDPTKVTIWGQSAGAGSVLQHLVANGGKTNPPLFRAAISSSSFLPSQYMFNDRIPETLYTETVAQTNCASAINTLACLREVDVNVLQAANTDINDSGFFGTFVFVPVVDGTFITERPTQLLKQGKVNGKIILANTNTFEGALFVNQSTADTVRIPEYVSQLFPNFTTEEIQQAVAIYSGLGSNIFQAIAIMGESIFICPTYAMLGAFGGKAFKGEFAIPPGGHGNDIAYYFPTGVTPPFANPEFDKAFPQTFLDFVTALNPNIKVSPTITPLWNLWAGTNEMLFNKTVDGAPDIRSVRTSGDLLNRCKFWDSVSASTAQ